MSKKIAMKKLHHILDEGLLGVSFIHKKAVETYKIIVLKKAEDACEEECMHWVEVHKEKVDKDGKKTISKRPSYVCSECGAGSAIKTKFCPNCGKECK